LGRYKDMSQTRCPSMNCQKRAHLQQGVFIRRVSCHASLVVMMGFGRRKSGKEKGTVQDALCEVILSLTSKRAEEASPRRCVYLRWTGAFAMIYIEPASEQQISRIFAGLSREFAAETWLMIMVSCITAFL